MQIDKMSEFATASLEARTQCAVYHAPEERVRMLSRPALSKRTKPPPDGSKMPVCGQLFTRLTVFDLSKRCP